MNGGFACTYDQEHAKKSRDPCHTCRTALVGGLFASDRSGARPGLEQRTRARPERRRKANDALRSRASRRSCLVGRISRTRRGRDRSKSRRFNRRGRGSDRLGRAGCATVCRDRHDGLPSSQTLKCRVGATFDATMPIDAPQSGGIHQALRAPPLSELAWAMPIGSDGRMPDARSCPS